MDKGLKNALSKLFDSYTLALARLGSIDPTYFLVKDKDIALIENSGLNFLLYSKAVIYQAQKNNVDALVLISENDALVGKKEDESISAVMKGSLKINDHPDAQPYLILVYLSNNGEKEALFGKIEKDFRGTKFIKDQEWASEIKSQIMV